MIQVASFDWAASDMHLTLMHGGGETPLGDEIVRSNESLAVDKDSSFETLSSIPTMTLTRGTYTLRMLDVFFPEFRALFPGNERDFCLRFSLSVDLVTLSDQPSASTSPSSADSSTKGESATP
jgi:hypothetical protein